MDQFESLAREANDALLIVRKVDDTAKCLDYEIAIGRLGSFAVTRALPGDVPTMRNRRKSTSRTYIVTHVLSGAKVGVAMTAKECLGVICNLRDVTCDTRDQIMANRDTIANAFPAKYRETPDIVRIRGTTVRTDLETLYV